MVNINSVLYWQTSRTFCYDTCQHLFAMTHVSTFLLWHMSAPFAITHVSTFCYDTCQHLLLWHMSAPFCYDTILLFWQPLGVLNVLNLSHSESISVLTEIHWGVSGWSVSANLLCDCRWHRPCRSQGILVYKSQAKLVRSIAHVLWGQSPYKRWRDSWFSDMPMKPYADGGLVTYECRS